MKTNLRILLQKRRTKPETWCRDNGIKSHKHLEQFLASSNYMIDQPLQDWVKFEVEAVAEQPKPVEPILDQTVTLAEEEKEELATEKPKRQTKKPRATDAEPQTT